MARRLGQPRLVGRLETRPRRTAASRGRAGSTPAAPGQRPPGQLLDGEALARAAAPQLDPARGARVPAPSSARRTGRRASARRLPNDRDGRRPELPAHAARDGQEVVRGPGETEPRERAHERVQSRAARGSSDTASARSPRREVNRSATPRPPGSFELGARSRRYRVAMTLISGRAGEPSSSASPGTTRGRGGARGRTRCRAATSRARCRSRCLGRDRRRSLRRSRALERVEVGGRNDECRCAAHGRLRRCSRWSAGWTMSCESGGDDCTGFRLAPLSVARSIA